MKQQLTVCLEKAALDLEHGYFGGAMQHLRDALNHANRLNHTQIKSLILRAMNHIRSAQKIGARS